MKSRESGAALDRALGLRQLVVYGMIFMVPIAPMAVYGFVAQESHGMVPLVYGIGIVAMLFTALSYKRLSGEFPMAGSVYAYVQRGWHPYLGFLAGWMILADYLLVPALLYAFSASWLQGLLPVVPAWLWVLGFVAFNTVVNIVGIRLQARAHFFLLWVELLTLAIFFAWTLHFVFIAGLGAGGWSIAPFFQPRHLNGSFVATATSIAVLSFLGFDAISTLAEEVRDPRRTVGNATVLALLLLGLIFIAQTYVAALAHPDYHSLDAKLGFFEIGREVGGAWLYLLLILVNVVSAAIANALSAQLAISRILFSMGRDRALPGSEFLSRVHPRLKTPVNATLLVAVLSIGLALLVPEEAILKLVNFGALTAFMLLNCTVFVFFYIRKRRYRHVFSYLLFPALGLVIVAFVWSGFDRTTFLFGGAWLLIGATLGVFRYRRFRPFECPPEADARAAQGPGPQRAA
ncbi:MAG TPA: APC family permease [Steroidobacteraceae bacterium]|nr:APC family permease [Steroidobacteraceae bacterium]